jgi:hypothetical protein
MSCKRTMFKKYVDELKKKKNCSKSRGTANVEQVLHILKRIFGLKKVFYRGIAKHQHRLCACFA